MDVDLLRISMDGRYIVETTAESVIREYLSRKGFKGTLKKMDEECPRNECSISNRQALMKQLNLEKLMKKNKENKEPLKTMLEIMAKYFIERRSQISGTSCEANGKLTDSLDNFGTHISFSPQTNEPIDTIKPSSRPLGFSVACRRDKDLVIDDDVQGESVIGDGMSSLFSSTQQDLPLTVNSKPQPNRPLSSRMRTGAIMSNNDDVKRRGQGHMMRPKSLPQSRMSVSQQEQQRRLISETPGIDWSKGIDSKSSSSGDSIEGNISPEGKNRRVNEDPPVSFEALLMKGTERANLLTRIGLEKRDDKVAPTTGSYKVETSSMNKEKLNSRSRGIVSEATAGNLSQISDLEVGDIDDLDTDMTSVKLQTSTPKVVTGPKKLTKIPSTPIDLKSAVALKTLVLGSASGQYIDEWKLQSFSFCDHPDLKYGMVQKKGGPCGVLAAVQACLIQEMLFGDFKMADTRSKNPTKQERSKHLAAAISRILWRAGDSTRAVVALPGDSSHIISSSKFKQDDITEKLSLYTFTKLDELSSFVMQSINQFETDGCPGVIIVMYSAILSRKPYQVRYDFDVQDTTMIASHGYCAQELVNLLLTGKAVSNTFNDSVILDSGGTSGDSITLKGLSARSEIGLLSLFEHYKSCQVGTYFKTPKFPVWVVCSESHFSVLFSTRRDLVNDWKAERRFDLFYYDGLSRQQEEIKLTISTLNQSYRPPITDEDLVPPLEHCIRTKWPDAEIDWNGYDPIL